VSAGKPGEPDRYAVIGHPVSHSLSPAIHAMFAEQTGQHLAYAKLPAPRDGFARTASDFFAGGGSGLNVTVPFKQEAAGWVDLLEGAAREAGAVNTISLESGQTKGFNTDGLGLVRDLTVNHGLSISGARVLVVGAGGATQGVVRPLIALGPQALTVANRTVSKAAELVGSLGSAAGRARVAACAPEAATGPFDLVINATSAGLEGHGEVVPADAAAGAVCYDMVYSTGAGAATAFCEWALGVGAVRAIDGLGMLVEQAAEAFLIWRGVRPDTAPVIDALRRVAPPAY
jgi:shikimate dehydrogenase